MYEPPMIGAPSFNVRINPENTEIVISYEPPVIGAPFCKYNNKMCHWHCTTALLCFLHDLVVASI
jgi:hypothetical protein